MQNLITQADALHLADDPYWHILLHYQKKLNGCESQIDDPKFFLSPEGKKNPAAELHATITALFSQQTDLPAETTAHFPARYAWLCGKLSLPIENTSGSPDSAYQTIKDNIKPDAVYLVFPAGYMKNPASLFGHTFLLIESQGKSRLLGYAVTYGVTQISPSSVVNAVKGLFGAYRGEYSFVPYYQKIREYGDMDMRDMWEYKLNLSAEEIDRLFRHVVEMNTIYSSYYFISENCSYNLLYLLEAARPDLKLTDKFPYKVEPIATVKLIEKTGLTGELTYRPSLYAKLAYEKQQLSARQAAFVKAVCRGTKSTADCPFTDMPPEKEAVLWDTAADYLKFLLAENKISAGAYRTRLLQVLAARTKIAGGAAAAPSGPAAPEPPHKAHGSGKVSISAGADAQGFYTEAGWRLTAHEFMDSDAGYTLNSQLAFFCINSRFQYSTNTFSLQRADFADVISLPVSDSFLFNHGFAFRTGLESNTNRAGTQDLAWRVRYGYGTSIAPANHLQLYAFGVADSYFSTAYAYGTDLLLGGELGLITECGLWKNKLSATVLQSPFAADHLRISLSADERFALSQNSSLVLSYSYGGDYGQYSHTAALTAHFFY